MSAATPAASPDDVLAERTISDVETLKALSDPVRLRILETMVQAPRDAWTVKRLAAALEVGPTKLYHHIAILEERELIRVAGTRVVSGIIETSYRIAQLSVRLDRSLLSSAPAGEAGAAIEETLRSIFDTAREDVAAALRSGAMRVDAAEGSARGVIRQDLHKLTEARAAELKARLAALLAEFEDDPDDASADGQPYGLLVALYPIRDRAAESGDD
jgi:DNA-binding transcriptional ArsR family regulator